MSEEHIPRRNTKDSVFTHLFSDKQYVLQLYQALHPEAENITEDMIEIVTLQNVMVGGMYNDLGFMLEDHLVVLVEAQSSWTPNIIPRALMYAAETYHRYFRKQELNLYSGTAVALPRPELYVIYTGRTRIRPGTYTLSEEFFGGRSADIEARVRVLTDSRQGDIINQYVAFTRVLDEQIKLHGRTAKAIEETIRICKDADILRQYLAQHEVEVSDIMFTLFDEDWIYEMYEKELVRNSEARGIEIGKARGIEIGEARGIEIGEARGIEIGEARGKAEGEARGEARGEAKATRSLARSLFEEGFSDEMVARLIKRPVSEVQSLKAELEREEPAS